MMPKGHTLDLAAEFRQQPSARIWVSLGIVLASEISYMSEGPLERVRILLGVCGGIAAYKAAGLVRRLRDAGADVRVVMTQNALNFVGAATFQALSGNPVRSSLWDESAEAAMSHIELARWAEHVLVAPASADFIARLVHGRADDLLSTLILATTAPVSIAPAMNQQMWANAATQENVSRLRDRGVCVIPPDSGSQACGEVGEGRMPEPESLVAELVASRAPRVLDGIRVLVSAGPTFEDIDPVRFIGNRSSGRMGFAVAAAAAQAGATVRLVSGPVSLPSPVGIERIDVRSARQMRDAVLEASQDSDIFISAAAVGDYRVQEASPRKLKKSGKPLTLELIQNPDILSEVAALPNRPFLVGFAAETEDVEHYARDKLARKKLDMIAANRVGAELGFECSENALLLLWDGGSIDLGQADKRVLARTLVEQVASRYRSVVEQAGPA